MTSSLIRHQLNDAVSGHSRLKEQYAELQREYVECFRRLAKILLEAASKHIPSHEVQLDLAKRAQRRSDLIVNAGKLDAELKEKLDALVSMENRLAYLQKERDKRLLGEPFAVMQKNIEQERSRYEKKHAVLSSVNNDLKELVMSYEANEYYQYLKAKKICSSRRSEPV